MFYNNILMSDPICIDCAGGGIINCGSINNIKYFYVNDATIVFVQNYNEIKTSANNHVILYGFIDIKTGHAIVSSLFFPLVISTGHQLFLREIQTNITLNGETNITFYPYYIPRTNGTDTTLGTLNNIGNIIAGKIQFADKGGRSIYNHETNLNQDYVNDTAKLYYYVENLYRQGSDGNYFESTTGLDGYLVPLYVVRTQGAREITFTKSDLVFKISEVEFNIKQRQANRYNTST